MKAWSQEVDRFLERHFKDARPQHGSTAANYYWERKRALVLDVLNEHESRIRSEAGDPRSPLFVDVGCGDGNDLVMIADFFSQKPGAAGWRFVGIDGFPDLLAQCRATIAARKVDHVEVRVANITRALPLADSEVDVLYCSEVLEHIPQTDAFLDEFVRVVRPGGYVLMTTPNQPNVFQRSWWSRKRWEATKARNNRVAHESVEMNGERVNIYGHVTLHPAHEWDAIFARRGFARVDFRRGAATYGGQRLLSKPPVHGARLGFEWLLDRLPRSWSRELSDEVITLYRKGS